MQKSIHLELPTGFRVVEKTKTMHISRAEKLLLSKRRCDYIKAVRNGEEAQLTSKYYICPFCGTPHAANKANAAFYPNHRSTVRDNMLIKKWASMQMSMFDDSSSNELNLARNESQPAFFRCNRCEHTAAIKTASRQVDMTLHRKKITVRCEILMLHELLSMELIKKGGAHITFPLFECVTFDLGKGRVLVKAETADGEVLCCRDVTHDPKQLTGGAFYRAFNDYKAVERNLKRLFAQAWGAALPFCSRTYRLDLFFRMTTFVGYPAVFYFSVPLAPGALVVEKSFRAQAKKLHFAKNIDTAYTDSGLPQIKSVRRIVFENPGLCFYAEEICELLHMLGDHNLLCTLLRNSHIYEILSDLHMRPGIFSYLRDYIAVMGAKRLLMCIEKSWELVSNHAIDYACMSQALRLQTQSQWKAKSEAEITERRPSAYSIPRGCPDERIKDCVIDGYQFFWLRNSNDYQLAGEQLNNCLGQWPTSSAPVVCMKRNEHWLAAIAVSGNEVVDALGYDNRELEVDPRLYGVLKKWMQRNHLTRDEEYSRWCHALQNDDDMPF